MKRKTKRAVVNTLEDAYLAHTDRIDGLCDNFAAAVPDSLRVEWQAFIDNLKTTNAQFEKRIEEEETFENAMKVVREEANWCTISKLATSLSKDDTRSLVSDIASSQGFILLAPQDAWQHERCETFAAELFPAYNDHMAFTLGL